MPRWQSITLGVLALLAAFGLYRLRAEGVALEENKAKLRAELGAIQEENAYLVSRREYLKNPENMLKELKSQRNYRRPDERLFIIVPESASASPQADKRD